GFGKVGKRCVCRNLGWRFYGNVLSLRKGIQHRRFNIIGTYGVLFERMRIEICISRRKDDSMQKVVVIDTRPQWMKDEDEMMFCMTRCSLFRRCRSRFGHRCKRLGGNEIPKT